MLTRKSFFITLLLSFASLVFAEDYTQNSVLSVMSTSYPADVSYSVTHDENSLEKVLLTVHEFSYKDKTVGEFSVELLQDKNNKNVFTTKNTTVKAVSAEKTTDITISSLELSQNSLVMKFKPGKMPFNITLKPAQ